MKYSETELIGFAQEIERATKAAQSLLQKYRAVWTVDDGGLVRDESLLPASKDDLRRAIVVVACVSDDAPNVAEIAQDLIKSWLFLDFFGDPAADASPEVLARLNFRVELAPNEAAKAALNARYMERYAALPQSMQEEAEKWFQERYAIYRQRLQSGESRVEAIRSFADGSVPSGFFEQMMRAAQGDSAALGTGGARAGTSGCLVLIVLAPLALCRASMSWLV